MPKGDGTGPMGQGGGKGRGQRQRGGRSAGPGGNCVCLNCGETISHRQGMPCNQIECPKCGYTMSRQRFSE